jgi:hypothetical protein
MAEGLGPSPYPDMTMKTKTPHPCMTHVQGDHGQAVAAELHVLIMPGEDGGFIAQGIEIDYVAAGATEEEVQDHFAKGFCATIVSYLKRGRDLSGLFKTDTPAQYRKAYFATDIQPVLRCAVGVREQGVQVPESAPIPAYLNFVRAAHARA